MEHHVRRPSCEYTGHEHIESHAPPARSIAIVQPTDEFRMISIHDGKVVIEAAVSKSNKVSHFFKRNVSLRWDPITILVSKADVFTPQWSRRGWRFIGVTIAARICPALKVIELEWRRLWSSRWECHGRTCCCSIPNLVVLEGDQLMTGSVSPLIPIQQNNQWGKKNTSSVVLSLGSNIRRCFHCCFSRRMGFSHELHWNKKRLRRLIKIKQQST